MSTSFRTPPNLAYRALGALDADRRWCAFDVITARARLGEARLLVMTLWDNRILRDSMTGLYWYQVPRHKADGSVEMHRDLLCEALRIAINQAIPITGVLKSGSGKRWCSLDHLFSILSVKEDEATDALWLNLLPHSSDIGCAPVPTAIHFAERVPDQDQQIRLSFEAQVAAARDDGSARRARLAKAPKIPRRTAVTAYTFVRNPDVVAEVLERAGGKCGYCGKAAPFFRKKSRDPYLEVHHEIPLADGGEDTVENAKAACPNCHRQRHYG